jgi:hypothetical protein
MFLFLTILEDFDNTDAIIEDPDVFVKALYLCKITSYKNIEIHTEIDSFKVH